MGKTGIDKVSWDSVVSNAGTTVAKISKPSIKELEKTTLKPLKDIEEIQKVLIQTVEIYKEMAQMTTQKMKQVGEKIVSEDKAASQSFQDNAAKVRFK